MMRLLRGFCTVANCGQVITEEAGKLQVEPGLTGTCTRRTILPMNLHDFPPAFIHFSVGSLLLKYADGSLVLESSCSNWPSKIPPPPTSKLKPSALSRIICLQGAPAEPPWYNRAPKAISIHIALYENRAPNNLAYTIVTCSIQHKVM